MNKVLLKSNKQDWLTPNTVLDRVRIIDPIGLDPCGDLNSLVNATNTYLISNGQDGLSLFWDNKGLVFCNPPYGRGLIKWARKVVYEAERDAEIILLVPARPDTKWFSILWNSMDAVCLWKGRIKFDGAPHPAPFPSALFYFGPRPLKFRRTMEHVGIVVS